MTGGHGPSPRTSPLRNRDRVSHDPDTVRAVLDEAYHCHLAFVVDGEPRVLPTLHVRIGDTVYVHGSTGSRPVLATAGAGLPVCLAVTLLDGIVYARSQVHHSANYRSVVAHGTATPVRDDATKRWVLDALLDKFGPGRAADSRPPTRKELAETAVLALPLREVTVKARTGQVREDEEDLQLPYWAGVVPLRTVPGPPEQAPEVAAAAPSYLPVR